MTVTTAQQVPVWGFTAEELATWPADLRPAPLEGMTEWPADRPIVVHIRRAEAFAEQALAHLSPSGALPDAILAVPPGEVADPATRADFDAAVSLGAWEELRPLLETPRQFSAATAAEMVPLAFLAKWHAPLDELTLNDLPDDVRDDAAAWWEDSVCRRAFLRALENRRTFFQAWAGPPPAGQAALRQWLRARPMPEVEDDDVAAAAMRRPRGRAAIILASLDAAAIDLAKQVVDGLTAPGKWLAQALRPPEPAWAIASGAVTRSVFRDRRPGVANLPDERGGESAPVPPAAIDLLKSPRLRRADRTVSEVELGWDEAGEAILIKRVGTMAVALTTYGLAVRRGDRVLWEGRSDPETGRLRLPAEALAAALLGTPASDEPVELELLIEQM